MLRPNTDASEDAIAASNLCVYAIVATLGPQEAGGYNRPLLLLPEDPRANPNWRPTDEMGVPTTQPPAQRWRIHPIGGAGLYLYEDGYKEDGHLTALGVKDTRRKDACGGPMLRVALENLEVYPPVWLRKGGKEGLEAARVRAHRQSSPVLAEKRWGEGRLAIG